MVFLAEVATAIAVRVVEVLGLAETTTVAAVPAEAVSMSSYLICPHIMVMSAWLETVERRRVNEPARKPTTSMDFSFTLVAFGAATAAGTPSPLLPLRAAVDCWPLLSVCCWRCSAPDCNSGSLRESKQGGERHFSNRRRRRGLLWPNDQ